MSERTTGRADGHDVSVRILDEEALVAIEQLHPEGLTAKEVVQIFSARGGKVSEATFRKYVQLGLLPRSRRVRRQGRRGGSLGLYPVSVVRRVNEIKSLLAQDFTMEEIRQKFHCARSEIDEVEESLTRVFTRLEQTVDELRKTGSEVSLIARELQVVRTKSEELTTALRGLERRLETPSEALVDESKAI